MVEAWKDEDRFDTGVFQFEDVFFHVFLEHVGNASQSWLERFSLFAIESEVEIVCGVNANASISQVGQWEALLDPGGPLI